MISHVPVKQKPKPESKEKENIKKDKPMKEIVKEMEEAGTAGKTTLN